MYRIPALLVFILLPFCLSSQVNLGWSVNTTGLPDDTILISPFTPYIDTSDLFVQSGFHAGDIVPDFTFYDTASQPQTLSAVLSEGKPLVLVSISLTCPASRNSMTQVLPTLVAAYGNQVNFMLVYTLEAHPVSPYVSPYSGTINTTTQNFQDSILYPQARRYFHRKFMAAEFIDSFNPAARVVIDGPGNEFWSHFGPAPNNAYLLAPNGMVYKKYGWFSRSVNGLMQDIPVLLNSVGTAETASNTQISIYPNPSFGNTFINTNETTPWSFYVYDLSGKMISSAENIAQPYAEIPTAELPAGIYFVEVATKTKREHFRLLRN